MRVFELNNPAGLCTGMSTHWLRQSMAQLRPLEQWNQADDFQAAGLTHELGNATVDRVDQLGWNMGARDQRGPLTPGQMAAAIADVRNRWFYMTMRFDGGSHAMAGYRDADRLYIFEPNRGIYRWNIGRQQGVLDFIREYPEMYGHLQVTQFTIYPILGRRQPMLRQHQRLPQRRR